MISVPLLKATIRSNYKMLLIFMAITGGYFLSIIGIYDPQSTERAQAMIEALPKELAGAMNFTTIDPTLVGFIAGYFYGFLILFFPLMYSVIIANRMIAKHVDRGSMAYLLSTPSTRVKIAVTQGTFLIAGIGLLIGFVTLLGVGLSAQMFPGKLQTDKFLLLNLGVFLLYFALSGIGFFASCVFNETKNSLAVGAGIPVAFLLLKLLAGVGEELSALKYATLLTLFNPADIIAGAGSVIPSFAALAALGFALYAGGILIFNKKDLPV
jgi:ABC-2 type transport system permease protein